jgi:hypothetical protein
MTHPKYRDDPGCDWCGGEPVTWVHVSSPEPFKRIHRKLDQRCIGIANQETADGILEPPLDELCICGTKEPR